MPETVIMRLLKWWSVLLALPSLSLTASDVSVTIRWISKSTTETPQVGIVWENNTARDIYLDPNRVPALRSLVLLDANGTGHVAKIPPAEPIEVTKENAILLKAGSKLESIESLRYLTQVDLKDVTLVIYYDYVGFRGDFKDAIPLYTGRVTSNALVIKKLSRVRL